MRTTKFVAESVVLTNFVSTTTRHKTGMDGLYADCDFGFAQRCVFPPQCGGAGLPDSTFTMHRSLRLPACEIELQLSYPSSQYTPSVAQHALLSALREKHVMGI